MVLTNLSYIFYFSSMSAVESSFSQYKHATGGKLDSINYTTVRGAHLMKQIISEHHSGVDYRNQAFSVAELGLKKKSYNKTDDSKKIMIIFEL